ncbi:MAG: EVE domain-containing protein [Alphaproteobacteria bacterium]|nr:EVE domain-containing protein [Alphaproteobacteria bacterium]
MKYWLLKSEPFKYSFDDLQKDAWTFWDGVRNYAARNNLKTMEVGDKAFFYHSNEGLEIVGIVEIIKTYYQDPTTQDTNWVVVDIKPLKKLKKPISLSFIKTIPNFKNMSLIKHGRLSVQSVTEDEFNLILKLSNSK